MILKFLLTIDRLINYQNNFPTNFTLYAAFHRFYPTIVQKNSLPLIVCFPKQVQNSPDFSL